MQEDVWLAVAAERDRRRDKQPAAQQQQQQQPELLEQPPPREEELDANYGDGQFTGRRDAYDAYDAAYGGGSDFDGVEAPSMFGDDAAAHAPYAPPGGAAVRASMRSTQSASAQDVTWLAGVNDAEGIDPAMEQSGDEDMEGGGDASARANFNFNMSGGGDAELPSTDDPGDVIFKGTLSKCNAAGRFWRARYCVLTNNQLIYYSTRTAAEADMGSFFAAGTRRGSVDVTAAHVFLGPGPRGARYATPTPFVFRINTGRRTYVFAAADEDALMAWVGALVAVTHGSLAAVVPGSLAQ